MDLNVAMLEADTSLSPEPVLEISQQPQSRGRRRSRRISGLQPDPTLTQEDLCLTPAKRAKDRSASRDRRSAMSNLCPGEHSATPRETRETPRISRKSTLSEVGSDEDITEPATAGEANTTAGVTDSSACTSMSPEPVLEISQQAQSRGRRRSRRISRLQLDHTLTEEDLFLTPAKRAKDRSNLNPS